MKISLIIGMLLMSATPVLAHHCEESKPGVAETGSFDHGKKFGLHSCAPHSKKLGLGADRCIPVYDRNGNKFCQ